jgi:hypothetical protein
VTEVFSWFRVLPATFWNSTSITLLDILSNLSSYHLTLDTLSHFFFSLAPTLEHRASVKCFDSLQFLNPIHSR